MDYINSYHLFKVFPNNQEIKKQHQDKNTFKKYTFFFLVAQNLLNHFTDRTRN